jgi:hypothetical protein
MLLAKVDVAFVGLIDNLCRFGQFESLFKLFFHLLNLLLPGTYRERERERIKKK